MCRIFLPFWLLSVLLLGGCGAVWKFSYTFPGTVTLDVKADALYSGSAPGGWTLNPPTTAAAPAPATTEPQP